MPATGTAQIRYWITSPPRTAPRPIDRQTRMFSSTGAAAAAAKWPVAFSAPENSAASEISRI